MGLLCCHFIQVHGRWNLEARQNALTLLFSFIRLSSSACGFAPSRNPVFPGTDFTGSPLPPEALATLASSFAAPANKIPRIL